MAEVPDDFPTPALIATVPGAQEKFSCTQGADGRLAPSGGNRAARYERCAGLVEWASPFLAAKLAKPEHAGLSRARALQKLRITLRREVSDVSDAEGGWILARVDATGPWRERAGEE
jgi:hypothetical protein